MSRRIGCTGDGPEGRKLQLPAGPPEIIFFAAGRTGRRASAQRHSNLTACSRTIRLKVSYCSRKNAANASGAIA